MAAIHLLRALSEFFPARAIPDVDRHAQRATAAAASSPPVPAPREIGRGAPNETFVTINGVPHLFVDEGDCVVQFRPAFEEGPHDTQFGTKILPELVPHWSLLHEHRTPLKDAIASAIRSGGAMVPGQSVARPGTTPQPVDVPEAHAPEEQDASHEPAGRRRASRERVQRRDDFQAAAVGTVLGWGEEKFPNRKPGGKPFYTSFAMHIETVSGERTLQGEGLKDAIAQCRCQVGDVVSVRRLEKIKVPAFTDGGRPIMKNGQQVLWDKWLWSITRKQEHSWHP